ncbi:lipoprotein LpqH [Mycobacterium kiyosense]|uniref:lipoprotein LpqH n=1 Tax=Mycobacterium kiyosense TaxID=2871094 RepID=UPI001F3FCB3F|nr:lipoprotein LpqH [Mycobacterium kiyosense]
MKRQIVVGLIGLVTVIACVAGCSSHNSNSSASNSAPAAAGPQVIVDGKNLNVSGPVTCKTTGDTINIGIGDPSKGIGAVVSKDNPPIVHAVGLGNVDGITLGFSDAAKGQGGNAGAAVADNAIQIKGTASGADVSDPHRPKPVTKQFEMDVTCP